jgi:hypothetical protein
MDKISKTKIYDYAKGERTCLGGTTTFIYDEKSGAVELEYLSLVGTVRNCAGGMTPGIPGLPVKKPNYFICIPFKVLFIYQR